MSREKILYASQGEIDNLRERSEIIKLPVPEVLMVFVLMVGGMEQNVIRYVNNERGIETWIEEECGQMIQDLLEE